MQLGLVLILLSLTGVIKASEITTDKIMCTTHGVFPCDGSLNISCSHMAGYVLHIVGAYVGTDHCLQHTAPTYYKDCCCKRRTESKGQLNNIITFDITNTCGRKEQCDLGAILFRNRPERLTVRYSCFPDSSRRDSSPDNAEDMHEKTDTDDDTAPPGETGSDGISRDLVVGLCVTGGVIGLGLVALVVSCRWFSRAAKEKKDQAAPLAVNQYEQLQTNGQEADSIYTVISSEAQAEDMSTRMCQNQPPLRGRSNEPPVYLSIIGDTSSYCSIPSSRSYDYAIERFAAPH